VKDQAIKGLFLGAIAFFILSKINLKFLRKFSFLFYIFNTLLLGLVFVPDLLRRVLHQQVVE